jgi:hypothetical protein
MASRDPLTWAAVRAKVTPLPVPSTNAGRFAVVGAVVLLLLLVLPWYGKGHKDDKGVITYPNAALVNPILGGFGALFLIYAAIRQARIASERHEAQTKADQQRRITDTFSKAVEQLGSGKIEVRVGGIYTLERLADEANQQQQVNHGPGAEGNVPASDLYWTVMETLTAFVRERHPRFGREPDP